MLVQRQTRGYAIVRLPDVLLREYENRPRASQNAEVMRVLREATPLVDPAAYRGFDCEPLESYPADERSRELWRRELGSQGNDRARIRMGQIIGDDLAPESDDDLLGSFDDARAVFELLDAQEFENILLERDVTSVVASTLSFDVGYWGGDHYSILNDSLVRPTWHGPDPDDLRNLAEATRDLNQHVPFDDAGAAETFADWYASRPWAEIGTFVPLRVSRVD